MSEQLGSAKVCKHCGQDCTSRPRVKDAAGRYYCRECHDLLQLARESGLSMTSSAAGSPAGTRSPGGTAIGGSASLNDSTRVSPALNLGGSTLAAAPPALSALSGTSLRAAVRPAPAAAGVPMPTAPSVPTARFGPAARDSGGSRVKMLAVTLGVITGICMLTAGIWAVSGWVGEVQTGGEARRAILTIFGDFNRSVEDHMVRDRPRFSVAGVQKRCELLDNDGAGVGGEYAKVQRGLSSALRTFSHGLLEYQSVADQITELDAMEFHKVTKGQLSRRITTLTALRDQTQRVSAAITGLDTTIQDHLRSHGVHGPTVDSIPELVKEAGLFAKPRSILHEQVSLFDSLVALNTLLRDDFGNWEWSPSNNAFFFDNDATRRRYTQLTTQIEQSLQRIALLQAVTASSPKIINI